MAAQLSTSSASSTPQLTATYTSPLSLPFTHTQALPSLPTPHTTAQKTSYLAALRTATAQMQEGINKELTQRMEEDVRRAAEVEVGKGKKGGEKDRVDDKREEENYGEEVVDED